MLEFFLATVQLRLIRRDLAASPADVGRPLGGRPAMIVKCDGVVGHERTASSGIGARMIMR